MNSTVRVRIVVDSHDRLSGSAPVSWAVQELQDALSAVGLTSELTQDIEGAAEEERVIVVGGESSELVRTFAEAANVVIPAGAEAVALFEASANDLSAIIATGSDVTGVQYSLLELADRVRHASDPLTSLNITSPILETPTSRIRSSMRLFTSVVEDSSWFYDRGFWDRYLSMLVRHRFNRFHLALGLGYNWLRDVTDVYFVFAYPYLVDVPGYNVTATGVSAEERQKNLQMLRFISDLATAKGLHFQLGLWTQQYEWAESPRAYQHIEGLDSDNHIAYCRAAVTRLLEECPNIAGITFRVHGESGIAEGNDHLWREIFEGIVDSGRIVEIDLHPKGVDLNMIKLTQTTGMPTIVSPKYTAEHMGLPYHQARIRDHEAADDRDLDEFQRSLMNRSGAELNYTRYGFADFLREGRDFGVVYRFWPGTQRFLLWGSTDFASGYSRFGSACDALGVEFFEPLSFKGRMGSGLSGTRNAYRDESLDPGLDDFVKFDYFYRVFGRHLYNPDSADDVTMRYLRFMFGDAAEELGTSLERSSKILPLITTAHHPSASNNRFWPEMYENMSIVRETPDSPYRDTLGPKLFTHVSAHDPELFLSIVEFADEVVSDKRSGKYSPLQVANWLDELSECSESSVERASAAVSNPASAEYRRLIVDVSIQNAIGRFFAAKLRAGTLYALYRATEEVDHLKNAVAYYRSARDAWQKAADVADVYRDDITYGEEPYLRGHWSDRLDGIKSDLDDMESELREKDGDAPAQPGPVSSLDKVLTGVEVSHTPQEKFNPGESVDLVLNVENAGELSAALCYRHMNQAEKAYQVVEMSAADEEGFSATIPGSYTNDSPFPLTYYFILRNANGEACLYPGLDQTIANQPYFVLRQA